MGFTVVSEQRDISNGGSQGGSCASMGRNLIAVIGIDRYQHWQRLSNAVCDAEGAAALFEELGFEAVTEPLLDDRATRNAIWSLVTDGLTTLGQDDSLVLFFSGHGATRKHVVGDRVVKTGYLIPSDAEDKVSTWVDIEGWLRAVALLPAKHILVILDACHSGIALDPVIKWRDGGTWRNEPLTTLNARRSRRIITSALDDQIALDSGPVHGHSLFTGCLINGLRHGILGTGSQVTTGSELGLYVQKQVESYPHSRQTPDFGTFAFDDRGEMVISLAIDQSVCSSRFDIATRFSNAPSPSPQLQTPQRTRSKNEQHITTSFNGRRRRWLLLGNISVAAVLLSFVVLRSCQVDKRRQVDEPSVGTSSQHPTASATDAVSKSNEIAIKRPDAALSGDQAVVEGVHRDLRADLEPRLRADALLLGGKADASSDALRGIVVTQLAQDLIDRAGLTTSLDADKLRKEAKELTLDAATAAQRALENAADDSGANIAMAGVLRLQGKPARDIKRYLNIARATPDGWAREIALADAMVLLRDGELNDAKAAFAAIEQGDGRLENSGDVRARFHLALALIAQGKWAEAKPLVDTILATQPDHFGAGAVSSRLTRSTTTSKDPRVGKSAPKSGPVGTPSVGAAHPVFASRPSSPLGTPKPVLDGTASVPAPAAPPSLSSAQRKDSPSSLASEVPSSRGQTQAELAAKLNEEGKELMYAEKYAEAARKFQEAVARVPEAKYCVNLCTARLQEGKLDEALTACNTVDLNNPTPDQKDRADKLIAKIKEEAQKQNLELHH